MSDTSSKQIFQTNNPTRWQSFQWGSRVLIIIAILLVVVLVITLVRGGEPSLPKLNEDYKAAITADKTLVPEANIAKEYKGFRAYITEKKPHFKGTFEAADTTGGDWMDILGLSASATKWHEFPAGIRSAFYVAWDPQSYFSLSRNISNLNLVIPEWFFIDPNADTVFKNVDQRGFDLMRRSGVKIMPMLSNNYKGDFRPDALTRIFKDDKKRAKLIADVLKECLANNFVGVNVDFEELQDDSDEPLILFMKELSAAFKQHGLLVTQDVSPYNNDYNYKELSKYCDYIFLMAYDEYSDTSVPGPVSSQKWIEGAVDEAAKKISADKIILCLAAYGYDWIDGKKGDVVTYQEALTVAKDNDATVKYNNDTYNLSYDYSDEDSAHHQVYFTDAATNFNTLRFATEYGLAGSAIWRLGSEDSRVWDFYDKDMRKEAISKLDFNEFNTVESSTDVDYIGEGEVLDIIATPKQGYITPSFDTAEMLISEERYDSLPSMFVVKRYGKAKPKQLLLTFDDGPDPIYTPQILDTLSKYHVPAAFFMVGLNMENNLPIVKRVYREGHEIGNHTFTHPNIAEVSKDRAKLEMRLTRLLIECITGHSTIYFRAPYNADSEPESMQEMIPVQIARERNYLDIGESIDPEDWQPGIKADTIFQRVVNAVEDPNGRDGRIILLHDAGGEDRKQTVLALPRIIDYFQKKGYTFVTVSSLLGKTKDDVMPPMPKGSGYYLLQINLVLAEIGYWGGHFLASCFIVFMILSCIRLIIMGFWSGREHVKERSTVYPVLTKETAPRVSIIVPAYNEEVNAISSLNNLLRQDYPNFDIIFIDDGSKDTTFEKVQAAFLGNDKVKVMTKPNGGKASALNYGIAQTDAEFVVCIDADTKLLADAVSQLMKHYMVEKKDGAQVGAVAGYVKVGNEVNLLTRWQAIEYISSQNFDRLAFAHINAITVVPGAIGAFRSKALVDAGGFTTDTLAEDCDLSVRILRAGYTIENENASVALTEAPESLAQFMKQRVRWSFGVMQTFWKNRDALFSTKYGALGIVALPNILLFQFIIPFFSPLADIFMVIGIISGNGERIGKYYLIFMAVDAGIAIMAFFLSKESMRRLVWLIPQRLGYRWIMYVVLYRSIKKAVKGELQHWGVLKRTGNVTA